MSVKIVLSETVHSFRYAFAFQVLFVIWGVQTQSNVESDVAEFVFLSSVNESRLHQNEYHHVISVNIPSRNSSYILHLTKPEELFSPHHLGIAEEDEEDYKCLFTGKLTSLTESVGMASLSSCFHETGFEGLISIGNDHYQVTPTSQLVRKKRSATKVYRAGSSQKLKVQHQIAKPMKASSTGKGKRSDTRRIPDAELKKAREQMFKDQESLDDEKDDDDDGSNGREDNLNEALNIPGDFDLGQGEGDLESVFGTRMNTNKQTRNKGKLSRVIELGIFTDEAFWKKWQAMYPEDTTKKINQYILALVNNMNFLYKQPTLDPKISYRLVNVGIQKNIPNGLKPTTIAEKYLDSFCVFAGKKDKNGAIWDHAMMITGLDMKDSAGNENLGIANMAVMCLRYWSCSLVKYNKGFETSFTAAHEMGHSLAMEHDGEAINQRCDPAKFLMAAIAGPNQINWSQCSNTNIKNFLVSGDNRANVKDPKAVPRCLTKRGSKRQGIRYRTGKWPGQIFAVKAQCQQACGTACTPYVMNKSPYNSVCKTLYCKGPAGKIVPVHPALEGTSCGQDGQKMCRNGRCQ